MQKNENEDFLAAELAAEQAARQGAKAQKGYWKRTVGEFKHLSSTAGAGVLAALGVVLKSLSIAVTQVLRISFFFLPTALSGYLYGPLVAGFAGVVVDILGYVLAPTGAYFPGFTLSAFVGGFLFGLWLYGRPVTLWRSACACVTNTVAITFILTPLWLNIMYGQAYLGLLAARTPAALVQLPFNVALLYMLLKLTEKHKKLLLGNRKR